MKNTSINIRVSEELKNKLEEKSIERNKKVSDLIRSALNDFVNDNLENENMPDSSQVNKDLDLLQTLGFTELVFWIYEKHRNPEKCETDELYRQFIDLIEEVKHHPLFTKEIINEFNKISIELQYYLIGNSDHGDEFRFPFAENGFNYQLFAEFLYGLRYDQQDRRVLTIK